MQPTITLADGSRLPTAPGSRVAITKQDNDITKPDSVQASYSTTFVLPDSQQVRQAVEHAQAGTSPTRYPYRQLRASLEVAGVELLPRGLLQLQGYQAGQGFEAQLFGGNKDFYATLGEGLISSLALGGGHPWNLASVAAGLTVPAASWQSLYCYDLVDRGRGVPVAAAAAAPATPWNIYTGELYPSIFARAIWEAIFKEAGYQWAGTLPESFDRLVLPAPRPYGFSDETIKQNSALIGWQHNSTAGSGGYFRYNDITRVEFTIPVNHAGPDEPFNKGAGVAIDGDSIVLSKTGYYDVAGLLAVYTRSLAGTQGTDVKVQGYIGGQGSPVTLCNDFATTNSTKGTTTQHSCSLERVLLPANTRLWLRCVITQESNILLDDFWVVGAASDTGAAAELLTEAEQNGSLRVTLLQELPEGAPIQLQDWLPELSKKDFIKQVVLLYGLTQRPHPYLNLIEFYPTSPTVAGSLATAPTWDSKTDSSRPKQVRYQVGAFAQANYLGWKEDSSNWLASDPEGRQAKLFGRGTILCADENLPTEKELFTLAFAATPAGEEGLPLLAKWQAKPGATPGSTNPADYQELQPEPRLLLRSPTATRFVTLSDNAGATQTVEAVLSYFASSSEAEDLTFTRTLGPMYYAVLAAALRAPRLLSLAVRLTLPEVAAFSQGQAVWLEAEGHYFYVNKLSQYEPQQPSTAAELIRLTF